MIKKKVALNAPGKNGFVYREQYGLVVLCKDEAHQRQLYDELRRLGLKVRVVAV